MSFTLSDTFLSFVQTLLRSEKYCTHTNCKYMMQVGSLIFSGDSDCIFRWLFLYFCYCELHFSFCFSRQYCVGTFGTRNMV